MGVLTTGIVTVPLINPIKIVVHRLDRSAGWATDPPGTETTGYDPVLEEPRVSWTTSPSGRTGPTRVEMTAVEVPAQVEVLSAEQLRHTFYGDESVTDIAFVLHRAELRTLGLLDATTGTCVLKPMDRVGAIKTYRGNRTVREFTPPLYIYEVRPRSWGFGTDGYDLEIVYTTHVARDYQTRHNQGGRR